MNLEPEVRAHLDAMAHHDLDGLDPAARRQVMRREIDRIFLRFGEPGPFVGAVRDHRVPVGGGTITVRTYHPPVTRPASAVQGAARDAAGLPLLPLHVLLHGGGWTGGSIDELVTDADARHRCVRARCVVATVEYRLAPEHRFPVPVHDVIAAVRWAHRHADELGVDPAVLTLGGASAGANLAAAAVVGTRHLGLRGLVLEVPALDLSRDPDEVARALGDEPAALRAAAVAQMEAARLGYLGDTALGASPLASPLLAPDLRSFPETVIVTAGLDPLRFDGERFAARLRDAGVPVHLTCFPGALHGSPILTRTWATARRWQAHVVAHLRRLHGLPVACAGEVG